MTVPRFAGIFATGAFQIRFLITNCRQAPAEAAALNFGHGGKESCCDVSCRCGCSRRHCSVLRYAKVLSLLLAVLPIAGMQALARRHCGHVR